MKIAVVRKKYLAQGGGGAEKYARTVCSKLAERGHEVWVVAESFEAEESPGLRHLPIKKGTFRLGGGTVAFHRAVQRELEPRRGDFDIVYALCRHWPCDVFRVTEQVHVEWLRQGLSPWQRLNPRHRGIVALERQVYQEAHTRAVVTNSEMAKREVLAHYPYPASQIHVIRNGVDRDAFHPSASPEERRHARASLSPGAGPDTLLLLLVAGNFKIKGLREALESLGRLDATTRERMELHVVGGDDPAPYLKLAEGLGLAGKIHFLGEKTALREYYMAADLLLYPSLGEPFANVCLEACACALPVLTTARNGAAELVETGRNGFVVPEAADTAGMAAALRSFAALDAVGRAAFSATALAAAAEYDWDVHVDRLEALFNLLLRERHDIRA